MAQMLFAYYVVAVDIFGWNTLRRSS